MPSPSNGPPAESGESGLSRAYARVLLIEAVVIAALYWFGRHFA